MLEILENISLERFILVQLLIVVCGIYFFQFIDSLFNSFIALLKEIFKLTCKILKK